MSIPPDDTQPDTEELLTRGVARMLQALGYSALGQFTLRSGRRADVMGLNRRGHLVAVEIKRSLADLRADRKWPEYLEFCDAFYFAVPPGFPVEEIPGEAGLILADRYGAETIRPWPADTARKLHASRRKEITLRFATVAAERLQRLLDPEADLSIR